MTRRRQHRLRPEGPEASRRTHIKQAGRRAARADQPARQGAIAIRTSSRAASSSASPWPGPSRSSPRSCCSTSRCPRSTPRSASPCATRSAQIQRQLGITTVYVTHDQEEALVAVRPGRRHERGPDRADRHAVRDLQLPGDAVRRLVRRARSTSSQADGRRRGGRLACRSAASRSAPAQAGRAAARAGATVDGRAAAGDDRRCGDGRRRREPAAGHGRRTSSFLGSIVRIRVAARRRTYGRRSTRSTIRISPPPARRRAVTLSFPPEAALVLGAARGPRPTRPTGRPSARREPCARRPLDGIDLVIFDKDGTLIDFHAMWSGWVETLADDLERRPAGRPVGADCSR